LRKLIPAKHDFFHKNKIVKYYPRETNYLRENIKLLVV